MCHTQQSRKKFNFLSFVKIRHEAHFTTLHLCSVLTQPTTWKIKALLDYALSVPLYYFVKFHLYVSSVRLPHTTNLYTLLSVGI